MGIDRRRFLAIAGGAVAPSTGALASTENPETPNETDDDQVGCLVDTTLCIGCRQCEEACNRRNELPRPAKSFHDSSVLREYRRPTENAFTVVNEFLGAPSADQAQKSSTYAKTQCMHCLDPACVSACLVGALGRTQDGAVAYNPDICIGCRYCMVACPFQIPAYEYDTVLAPRVRKCEFCVDRAAGTGANPACAAACPTEALVFGKRSQLLELARSRIETHPVRYVDHIYGEHEVGGTAWLYLVGREPDEVGLLDLPEKSPPRLTESIQHGIFRWGAIPFLFYGALGAVMWREQRKEAAADSGEEVSSDSA